MTPFSAWEEVSPYIPRHLTLWEAFYGDGRSGDHLTELGFDVIHEDVDFFTHDLGECVVTNPPFCELPRILCVDHGGGPRCTADGCDKAAARLVGGGVDRCVDHRRSDQCTHCDRSLLYRNRRKATLGPAGRGTLCTSCGEKFRKGTWIADPDNMGKLLKVEDGRSGAC
jgi:hypothetical protein